MKLLPVLLLTFALSLGVACSSEPAPRPTPVLIATAVPAPVPTSTPTSNSQTTRQIPRFKGDQSQLENLAIIDESGLDTLGGVADSPTEDGVIPLARFTHLVEGFSIDLPPGFDWSTQDGFAYRGGYLYQYSTFVRSPIDDTIHTTVDFTPLETLLHLRSDQRMEELLPESYAESKKLMEDYTNNNSVLDARFVMEDALWHLDTLSQSGAAALLKLEPIFVNGHAAYLAEYIVESSYYGDVGDSPRLEHVLALYFLTDKGAYTVEASVNPAHWSALEATIQRILFSFDPGVAPNTKIHSDPDSCSNESPLTVSNIYGTTEDESFVRIFGQVTNECPTSVLVNSILAVGMNSGGNPIIVDECLDTPTIGLRLLPNQTIEVKCFLMDFGDRVSSVSGVDLVFDVR